jgi:hypothetical protein
MTSAWSRGVQFLGVVALGIAGAAAGCGGGGHGNDATTGGADGGPGLDGGGNPDGGDGGNLIGNKTIKSLSISPPSASITSNNGMAAKQPFTLAVEYSDGSMSTVSSNVAWTADAPVVGAIDSTGLFTANGSLGGVVHVAAAYMGQSATATLSVKLLLQQNPGNVPSGVQSGLQAATTHDASVVWAYPYDGTVWARGLLPPTLQWNGGAATDAYYVHIVSSTFELQEFTTSTGAPSSQLLLDATTWGQLIDSTSGTTQVTVARWDGTSDTVIANHTWTIAPASIRSTIYYWSNNLGRVLRIQPGAAQPDDFANQAPLTDPAQYQQNGPSGTGGCLMTCHTVSADGSTLASGGGVFAGSYDLKANKPVDSLGGTWDIDPNAAGQPVWENIQWNTPALSPTGKYVLPNSMAQSGVSDFNGPNTVMGLFTTADGKPVTTSGVTGTPFAAPAWSPDGARVAFVDSGDPSGWTAAGFNWQNPPPGDLKVIQFDETKNPMFSGEQTMVAVGKSNAITWPSVSADGQWIIYARAGSFDTRNGPGDLYFASAVTPNQEVRLAKLDGDGYPFAAGPRDLSFNYEPSFAPVAAGGYFWVVFTSRRTYGNTLTGAATVVKQLWVAAIDQNPKPGVDPSHPAFHLQGQDQTNLAMRGFMSLPPCAQNGQGCTSGTDCCGGYCENAADGGAPTCRSTPSGCSQNGDKCNTSSDCCNAASGVTCIAHVCSEPTPQ